MLCFWGKNRGENRYFSMGSRSTPCTFTRCMHKSLILLLKSRAPCVSPYYVRGRRPFGEGACLSNSGGAWLAVPDTALARCQSVGHPYKRTHR